MLNLLNLDKSDHMGQVGECKIKLIGDPHVKAHLIGSRFNSNMLHIY